MRSFRKFCESLSDHNWSGLLDELLDKDLSRKLSDPWEGVNHPHDIVVEFYHSVREYASEVVKELNVMMFRLNEMYERLPINRENRYGQDFYSTRHVYNTASLINGFVGNFEDTLGTDDQEITYAQLLFDAVKYWKRIYVNHLKMEDFSFMNNTSPPGENKRFKELHKQTAAKMKEFVGFLSFICDTLIKAIPQMWGVK